MTQSAALNQRHSRLIKEDQLAIGWLAGAVGLCLAAPLPTGTWQGGGRWHVPGGAEAVRLEAGKVATLPVTVPELTEKEQQAGGTWRGVIEVDGYPLVLQGPRRTLQLTGATDTGWW